MDLNGVVRLLADGPMPLIRTDFTSDDAWQRVIEQASKGSNGEGTGYAPNLEPISDPGFESVTPEALANAWPREHHGYVILADQRSMREAMSGDELTVAFVDLYADEDDEEEFGDVFGRVFRSVAREIADIEANLSIANVDFSDFADSAEDDGVFRGL